jgi:hypothetical protein
MHLVVLGTANAKSNGDLTRRGIEGSLNDLRMAVTGCHTAGVNTDHYDQAIYLTTQAQVLVEEAMKEVQRGDEDVLASQPYQEHHERVYGVEPQGIIQ